MMTKDRGCRVQCTCFYVGCRVQCACVYEPGAVGCSARAFMYPAQFTAEALIKTRERTDTETEQTKKEKPW